VATKKVVLTKADIKTRIADAIHNLTASADTPIEVAQVLLREGVRGAKCADSEKCPLAQYFANALEKGYIVSVPDFSVEGPGLDEPFYFKVPAKAEQLFYRFIETFDSFNDFVKLTATRKK
jgi:hypothetical protein